MRIPCKAVLAAAALLVSWAAPTLARAEAEVVTAAPPLDGSGATPLAVVAQFLNLTAEQVEASARLRVERERAIGPLRQEIARREQRIRELAGSGGDAAEIGMLVIEIHHLGQAVEVAQAIFLGHFESLLTNEQRRKWGSIRVAARLSPVLPAFQALHLL
jgi:Spy/CpxP family protein refolding chaperone